MTTARGGVRPDASVEASAKRNSKLEKRNSKLQTPKPKARCSMRFFASSRRQDVLGAELLGDGGAQLGLRHGDVADEVQAQHHRLVILLRHHPQVFPARIQNDLDELELGVKAGEQGLQPPADALLALGCQLHGYLRRW